MIEFWISLLVFGCALASLAYWVALRIQLMAVVDLVWTAGLGFGAIAYFVVADNGSTRAAVVTLLIAIWSFRLSYYLLTDRVLKREEDPRYVNLATFWGSDAKRNFYGLFIAQVFFVALFLWPVSIALNADVAAWGWSDSLALSIALVAFVGESLADRQLARFRARPENKGKVCREGLWLYSRHPNYFFEWLHWWAYVAFAATSTWWWALIGPAAMYVFLRYLTGIPHAERSSLKSRGEEYRIYQQTTSAFFPWIPHKPHQ